MFSATAMSQANDHNENPMSPASVEAGKTVIAQLANVSQLLDVTSSGSGNSYRHHLLKEITERRAEFISAIKPYFQEAHEDVRRYLRELAGISLAPGAPPANADPTAGYPQDLESNTLTGYFGEVFAAWVVENLSMFKAEGWRVPAFLFRFHIVELQQLEHIRQTGEEAGRRPGRTGDDLLAFQLDGNWKIKKVLYGEAKCTTNHDIGQVSKAHEKVGRATVQDIPRLIDILKDRQDADAQKWVAALREIYLTVGTLDRRDLVSYVCGQHPIQRRTWISTNRPHDQYNGNRHLDVIEVHFNNVEALVNEVYGKEVSVNAV